MIYEILNQESEAEVMSREAIQHFLTRSRIFSCPALGPGGRIVSSVSCNFGEKMVPVNFYMQTVQSLSKPSSVSGLEGNDHLDHEMTTPVHPSFKYVLPARCFSTSMFIPMVIRIRFNMTPAPRSYWYPNRFHPFPQVLP